MVNIFAIITDGVNKPGIPVGPNWVFKSQRVLLLTDGYFNLGLGVLGVFLDGSLLIRQPDSEDYLIDGTTLMMRLPWSENYEVEKNSKTGRVTIINRQSDSEDYLGDDGTSYTRLPDSENYETTYLRFIRQADSENYRIERK